MLWVFLGTLLSVLNAGQTISGQFVMRQKTSHESVTCIVLVTELMKIVITMTLIVFDKLKKRKIDAHKVKISLVLKMSFPALMYTGSNTLTYVSISKLGASNYQLWKNTSFIITALLHRIWLQKPLKLVQWISMMLLVSGLITVKSGADLRSLSHDDAMPDIYTGIVCILFQNFFASLAGVYLEILMKKEDTHLLLKNLCLYIWTAGISLVILQMNENMHASVDFTQMTWISILLGAFYGQIVSLALLYCDNILKTFSTSYSIILCVFLDWYMFQKSITVAFCTGTFTVLMSTVLFYCDPETICSDDSTFLFKRLRQNNVNVH